MSDRPSSEIAPAGSSAPATRGRTLDPFAMLSEMEEMMDRMFGRRWPFARSLRRFAESPGAGWAPQVDMYEQGDSLVVKAELPGVAREDIDVSLENGDLVIKGERRNESEVREENYYRMERSFGSFYRRLPMPEGIQPDQISASFRDGILEIRAPKPSPSGSEPKKIEIR